MTAPKTDSDPLVADLIHELRHPLMAIKMGLSLVGESLGAQLQAARDWPMVVAQVARIEELLKAYQQFVSPEGIAPDWFELGPALQGTIDSFQARLKPLAERFVSLPPASGLRVFGTAMAMEHALINVIANALDAIEPVGQAGRIEVRVLPEGAGGRTEIRVSDSGSGISEAASQRLFEAGFSTKPRGKGTGLGLAIARRVMEAIHGEVTVVAPGGAHRLPWAVTELRIAFPPRERPARPPESPGHALPRVLLVEDDPLICEMLKRGMEKHGFVVESAPNGEAAIARFGPGAFDAVVTDKNLPGASGLDVARAVRQVSPQVALVMITGYASVESVRKLRELTGDEYLAKPFEIGNLVTAVAMALQRRQNKRALETKPRAREFGAARRVVLVEASDADRARLARVLGDLNCVPLKRESLARALEELSGADALIVDSSSINEAARSALRQLRAARPDFKVVLTAFSDGLLHSMDVVLLEAGELVRPWSDEVVLTTLRRAFEPEKTP